MSMRKLNTKYGGGCTRVSNENSQLAKIVVDVVMPPMSYQKSNITLPTPEFEECKKECILDYFDNILEQTQKNVGIDNTNSFDKSRKVPNIVLKQISDRISFDGNVIEERSPHTIPFSQYNIHKIYDKTKLFKKKKKKNVHNLTSRNVPSEVPLISTKVVSVKSLEMKPSSESVLLGLNNSSERLKPSSTRRKSKQLTSLSTNDIDHKMPAQIWEEYVLSKLSKTTTDLILKDINPNYMDKYRNVLNQHGTEISDDLHNNKLENWKELEKKTTQILSKSNKDKIDSSVSYFANISNQHKNLNPKKNVQVAYPYSPSKWLESEQHKNNMSKMGRVTRGMQKWTGYPTFEEEEELLLQQISDTKLCDKSVKLPIVVAKRKDIYSLIPVVNEWRNKWILDRKSGRMSFADLQSEMKDISEHIRFAAVSAVGSVIIEQQQINIDEEEILLNAVTQLLDDDSSNVSLAAALTLFSMNKASTKATDILMKTVCNGHSSERWVAIQCLAEYQYHDNCIIRELISSITGDDVHKHEKAVQMLKKLSHLSMSIQYMVAEKLNSGSWRDRVVACQVLPTLHGTLTKDIADKLSYLLWNDWSVDVRKAAVEALGKTGNGKLVHNTLRKRLQSKNINKQITALKKIASLGIMTAHLLSPLILCLESDNDEVCLQAIKICMKMKLNDENVLSALITLLNSDRACKIRIYILRALGCIGLKSTLIRDNLLWTLHFNKEPTLRKEACSTIIKLGLQDEEIINVLQDIVFIDEDASVRHEVVLALCSMGLQAVGNITLTETIQRSVKQLCQKDNVIAHVVEGRVEKLQDFSSNKEQSYTDSSDDGDDSSNSDENENIKDDGAVDHETQMYRQINFNI